MADGVEIEPGAGDVVEIDLGGQNRFASKSGPASTCRADR